MKVGGLDFGWNFKEGTSRGGVTTGGRVPVVGERTPVWGHDGGD